MTNTTKPTSVKTLPIKVASVPHFESRVEEAQQGVPVDRQPERGQVDCGVEHCPGRQGRSPENVIVNGDRCAGHQSPGQK